MRLFCLLAVSLFILSSFFANVSLFASEPIRVLSINVRYSTANDGVNRWENRRDFMMEIVVEGNYDFIGTQETLVHPDPELDQPSFIAARLPGHGFIGRSREATPEHGEAMMLYYKKDRWKIDETYQGTVWLSDTPDVPGSKTDPTAGCPRTVVFALFHELNDGQPTGRSIYVYNTHFDHRSENSRQRGARQIMERVANRQNQDAPVIVMGDINSGEQSVSVRHFLGDPITLDGQTWTPPYKLVNTFREVHPDATDVGTFNFFGSRPPGSEKIDYVFVSPSLTTLSAEIIRAQREGRFPTDHFPVDAVIAW